IVVADHRAMLLTNVTRYGEPRADLAESTLKNPKRGPGPSLIPRGTSSRFYTNFETAWESDPGQWIMFLVCRYVNIVSKKGVSIVPYHENGTAKMPARPTQGLTPK